jgi:predicted nucleic acid-binding protein
VPIASNSSPLIALARIQRLDLVPAVFQSILVPPAAAREIYDHLLRMAGEHVC